jgi:hypothetical protein
MRDWGSSKASGPGSIELCRMVSCNNGGSSSIPPIRSIARAALLCEAIVEMSCTTKNTATNSRPTRLFVRSNPVLRALSMSIPPLSGPFRAVFLTPHSGHISACSFIGSPQLLQNTSSGSLSVDIVHVWVLVTQTLCKEPNKSRQVHAPSLSMSETHTRQRTVGIRGTPTCSVRRSLRGPVAYTSRCCRL